MDSLEYETAFKNMHCTKTRVKYLDSRDFEKCEKNEEYLEETELQHKLKDLVSDHYIEMAPECWTLDRD